MDSNISLIKALAMTLVTETGSLNNMDLTSDENKSFDLYEKVREFETKLIKTAPVKTKGNQCQAAKLLGVKPTTLHNKIKVLNIKPLETIPE